MPFLTRRQFIELTPAALTAELTAGVRLDKSLVMYLKCRLRIGDDKVYIYKINKLIEVAIADANPNLYCLIAYADRHLPSWMFRSFIDLIGVSFETFDFVHFIDNILYLLNFFKGKPTIHWHLVEPRSRIRELLPWFKVEELPAADHLDVIKAIMGSVDYCSLLNFNSASEVMMWGGGNTVCCWIPFHYNDFLGFSDEIFERMLHVGYIVVLNMKRLNGYGTTSRCIAMIMKLNLSYFIFDKKFIYGESNRIAWVENKDIDNMIENDKKINPLKYDRWLNHIKMLGYRTPIRS